MKRNRRKTFAYRPSDRIVSRESIISVVLGAAGILGYYLLLLGSVKTGGTSGVLSGAIGWILTALAALGLYLGVRSMEWNRTSSFYHCFCDRTYHNDLTK